MSVMALVDEKLKSLALPEAKRILRGGLLAFMDSEQHVIIGSVISIGYGPKEGVSFRVTSPQFHGQKIKSIVPSEGGKAILRTEEGKTFEGTFELI